MQQQLQLQYLTSPRSRERVLVSKCCNDLIIEDVYLIEPTATIIFDPETSLYRLILLDSSHSYSVTFELSPECLESDNENRISGRAAKLQAYFTERKREGVNITVRWTDFPLALRGRQPTNGGRLDTPGQRRALVEW
ncbi:hypothetical protein BDV96DRAFT_35310 [Lophiotrema nucula]|uniref:Uncharacterized protein n=1 Tax=Lophiotrema nucula TaxID=690887 RepID=A0A6A5ZDI3_9PLEO|nr:hypothetical protein BDV96DRAFT_35310 [Lophiotrema nucula]